jgi:hypothetical protein
MIPAPIRAIGPPRPRAGFTLVMTLSILAAVTILVVGLFGLVRREQQVSHIFDGIAQADAAAMAGLDRASAMLRQVLQGDNPVIFSTPWRAQEPGGLANQDEAGRPHLMTMAAFFNPAAAVWEYLPLASGVLPLPSSEQLEPPMVAGGGVIPMLRQEHTEEDRRALRRLPVVMPWQAQPARFWEDITLPGTEEGEELAARYCFSVEDLQGYLSFWNAGQHNRELNRPVRPGMDLAQTVVPGLDTDFSPPVEGEMRLQRLHPSYLFTLLAPGGLDPDREPYAGSQADLQNAIQLHRHLTHPLVRPLAFSQGLWRESLLVANLDSGWTPGDPEAWRLRFSQRFAARDGQVAQGGARPGSLVDPVARALEENLVGGLPSYLETARIPADPAISPQMWGRPKLNLNLLLRRIEEVEGSDAAAQAEKRRLQMEAVDQIAAHIQECLPQFSTRKGGFPLPLGGSDAAAGLAYLKNLAASMIDYADTDPMPVMDGNPMLAPAAPGYPTYRGIDAYPLVTEQWQRYRFERSSGGVADVSITTYLELWNMTNQRIEGEVAAAFECKGNLTVGFNIYPVEQSMASVTSGWPVEGIPGVPQGLWHAPIPVVMEPNEYRVVAFPPVVFSLRGGPASASISTATFTGFDTAASDLRSRYRLAFRPSGKGAQAPFMVVDVPLHPIERYERSVSNSTRQRFNTTHPGMSYALRNTNYANNVGDPRAAFYINYFQDVTNYDNGSSPWARNLRQNIGEANLYRENRVILWPDGGHNSVARTSSIGTLNRNPDDIGLRPAIHAGNSLVERQKYVQRISNAGRFFSVTELGHVFDPIMWDPNGGGEFNAARYSDFADLRTGSRSTPSDKYCGGNTLRIGRVEHERFRPDYRPQPEAGRPVNRALAASALLDIFHCGIPNGLPHEVAGTLERRDGHVNLNTASRDVLRALAAGRLVMDPRIKIRSIEPDPPEQSRVLVPAPVSNEQPGAQVEARQADLVAEMIIRRRPFVSPAEIADKLWLPDSLDELAQPAPNRPDTRGLTISPVPGVVLQPGRPLLGSSRIEANDRTVEPEWNDSAAEEVFARIFNNATVSSRNFRVIVTGQAVRRTRSGRLDVVATRTRQFHIFVRPIHDEEGNLINQTVEITYARNL